MWGGGKYAVNQIVSCLYSNHRINKESVKFTKKDVKRSLILSLTNSYEYICYDFLHKTKKERKEFITDVERIMYLRKYSGIDKFNDLYDKYKFYERMKDFFRRDVCKISSFEDEVSFLHFVKRHPKFIAKPNLGSYGHGIAIYDVSNENPKNVFDKLLNSGASWIIEELIIQSDKMAIFNASSVNTVRIPSFKTAHGIEIEGVFMRTGRMGMIVDNGGAGGIFVSVNSTTGIVESGGANELGLKYTHHPDSNVKYEGFKIPDWDELVSLAKKCHENLSDHKYIGWDFAHTNNGWVLIEGNWGQLLGQIPSQKGLKKRFVSLMKQ